MRSSALGIPLVKVAIRFEQDIVTARQKTRRISQLLGFDNQDQARLATAVSELARNVYQYAGVGSIEYLFSDRNPQTLFVRISDSGPGIPHLNEILDGTYISQTGMGAGLRGARNLMDHFDVVSETGRGTVVAVGKTLSKGAPQIKKEDLGRVADQLMANITASPFEEIQNQNRDLLNALEEVRASREELANLNRELAETNRGVVALYAELDEKASSLQRANEVKTSFLSNMTHEFRTPLSSIISLTRLLLGRVDGELTTEQEKQVNYIRKSSEGLLELVNDLLDLAKVEAGKVSIVSAPFAVEEVLSGLRGMFRPILNSNPDLDFEVKAPERSFELMTDQAKLSQILRNLVSNAIKYTERGTISVKTYCDHNDVVHFEVADSGIGIEPEFLEVVFEDFSQLESRLQKNHKGTGLGLPLSRKLARLLGGDIRVESVIGEGSSFHVAIPRFYTGASEAVLVSYANSRLTESEQEANEPSAKFKVVLIDDDEPSRYVLRDLVRAELDAVFQEASNGQAGLELIRRWKPDLVFVDLAMPNLDGFDVLRAINTDKSLRDLPVIVNTAKQLNENERDSLSKTAAAVLSKERTDHCQAVKNLRVALDKAGFDYKGK